MGKTPFCKTEPFLVPFDEVVVIFFTCLFPKLGWVRNISDMLVTFDSV